MGANISYNGFRIDVPVSELAEAVRQLQSLSLSPIGTGAPAAHQNVAAIELQTALNLDAPVEKRSEIDVARSFLEVIAKHHSVGGAPIHAVMAVLGAAHAKGVGSKAAIVNKALDKLGYAIPDVYTNERDSLGMRSWRAGPLFAEALQKLSPSSEEAEDEP